MDPMSVGDTGSWLVEHRAEMDRGEALWLQRLAEFDLAQGWAADGQLTCAYWLMWRTKMARATAYEKLQVAHELRRRPVVAEAFAAGRLSYSAVRAITRIERPDREVDDALVNLAEAGTVLDLERAVRFYQLHAGQHRSPHFSSPERRVSRRPNLDGTTTVQVTLEDSEAEEVWRIMLAFTEQHRSDPAATSSGPVDESAAADSAPCTFLSRMADALMDAARLGLAHIGEPGAVGEDRYMVHVVVRDGHPELLDGTALPPAVAERLGCDCSSVTHLLGSRGEPLALGRKTKQWSTAQRRAVMVRDEGRCRFPGCQNRVNDVHHHRWWTRGGHTDVGNGWLACPRHHTMVHDGFSVTGDPNGTLVFHRPDGTVIGSTEPSSARLVMAA
jgi:hypothetical protein